MKRITCLALSFFILVSPCLCSFGEGMPPMVDINFDDTLTDRASNYYNALPKGDYTFEQGVKNKALKLNDSYLELENTENLNFRTAFTLSLWVKPENSNALSLISKLNDDSLQYSFYFGINEKYSNFKGSLSFFNNPLTYYRTEGTTRDLGEYFSSGKWQHVALTYSENALKFYLNGRMFEGYKIPDEIMKDASGINPSSQKITIGKDPFANFSGSIDELKLYNRALGDSEIESLYEDSGLALNGKIEFNIGNPYMTVNGTSVEIDPGRGTAPLIENGRTLLPIRAVAEAIGAEIAWKPDEKMVGILYNKNYLQLWIDNPKAVLNYEDNRISDIPPMIINGRTMLPLRFISETLGLKVEWDDGSKKITLNYPILK